MPGSSRSSELVEALARFLELPTRERIDLVVLTGLVSHVALALRAFRFEHVRFVLERASEPRTIRPVTPEALSASRRLAELASIAGRRGPVRASCLPQALSVWAWARRRGLPAELRLGSRGIGGSFEAHAWVELGGVALGGDAGHVAFEGAIARSSAGPRKPT